MRSPRPSVSYQKLRARTAVGLLTFILSVPVALFAGEPTTSPPAIRMAEDVTKDPLVIRALESERRLDSKGALELFLQAESA